MEREDGPTGMRRRCLAGGPGDFMTVQHLQLRGSQGEIGRAMATEARDHFAWEPPRAVDPIRNRARRRWFERNWPDQHARMEGVAALFDRDLDDDNFDFSNVMAEPFAAHCSAVWCSLALSADGRSRVGRNLDFSTGTVSEMLGVPPQWGEPPALSRPFVVETYPDDGRAAIVCTVGDLTSCLDGINESGLMVAVLADDESTSLRPSVSPQAGLNEMHVLRYVLETCGSTDEAQEALYLAKQYDQYAVAHYLVADRHAAFVWERDTHNAEHVVSNEDGVLCVTNYLLHRQGVATIPEDLPGHDWANDAYHRSRILSGSLNGDPVTGTMLWELLESVRADSRKDRADSATRTRTLWHAQYDLDLRCVGYEFYLGDEEDGTPKRSPMVQLTLQA